MVKQQSLTMCVHVLHLAGGNPVRLDFTTAGIYDIAFHPDGTFISFTSLAKGPLEIWAMENFLSPSSGSNSSE